MEEQEGSLRGYNPKEARATESSSIGRIFGWKRELLWATLRSGNAGSANGCVEFIRQALTRLPPEHRIGLMRADASFFVKNFLEQLESEGLPYIIVARLTAVVHKMVLHRIRSTAWRVVARGWRELIWRPVYLIGEEPSGALSVCARRFPSGPRRGEDDWWIARDTPIES
jgi:hypothetical protein